MNPVTLYRQWKVPLSKSNAQTAASQVSLFDLLFYYKPGVGGLPPQLCTRFLDEPNAASFKHKGFELKHNIIVFDSNMYQLPRNPLSEPEHRRYINIRRSPRPPGVTDGWTFEDWSTTGFDICLPRFDKRTKPLYLTKDNIKVMGGHVSDGDFDTAIKYLKPNALDPSDFYYNGVAGLANGIKVWDKDATIKPLNSFDFYTSSAHYKESEEEKNNWDDYDPYKVAVENDWELMGDVNDADIVLCGRDYSFEDRFLLKDSGLLAYNGICLNHKSVEVWNNFLAYYNASFRLRNSGDIASIVEVDGIFVDKLNPVYEYLLKHCYVWVRCSFYADYIDYRDFDQQLNKDASVIHSNLMLTNKGDWKRYEKLFSTPESNVSPRDFADKSRPYMPTTTPSIDRLRDQIVNFSNPTAEMIDKINDMIEDANDPNSKIGSIPVEPFEFQDEGKDFNFTSKAMVHPPPIWFDTESRKTGADYHDYPIVMSKEGNLIIDGRVLSPSIDELWEMIKKLVGGRKSDTDMSLNMDIDNAYPRGADNFRPHPTAAPENRSTNFDSRPHLMNHKFVDINGKTVMGDPTFISYKIDDTNPHYEVLEWVNSPTYIQYRIISELAALNAEVSAGNIDQAIYNINQMLKPTEYLPSISPWTLREIEAQLKGLRWNLCYYMTYQKRVGVYNGPIGRANSDNTRTDNVNRSAGSLYQLHKNYNPTNIDQPNTVYDERSNRFCEESAPHTHNSNCLLPPSGYYGTGLGKITVDKTSNNKDIAPSWATYLGADGEWHSTKQCLLIPIRKDEYW